MLVGDLFAHPLRGRYHAILSQCSKFIHESDGIPVYRSLSCHYDDVQRVKVRYMKKRDDVSIAFSQAFESEYYNVVARGVYTKPTLTESDGEVEPFYLFIPDGYKYLYCKGVKDFNRSFKRTVETLQRDDPALLMDAIKFPYVSTNLQEGLCSQSEVIFFDIPYFYAVRVSSVQSYNHIINNHQL